jgi:hypothetical protein
MEDAVMQIAMLYAKQMVLATPVPPACTPVIGWAVEVARGVHLQAPAHAAGRRPAYCRRTACPCRIPWRLSLLPQITIMLTNERCPSKTERNRRALAAPVSAATARCATPDPCAMSRSIPAVESMVCCGSWLLRNILISGAHTLFEPGEAGVARANPHSNPVVPYYAAGRDPPWYLADGPPNCSYTVVGIRCGRMYCIYSPLRNHRIYDGKHGASTFPH